MDRRQFLRAGAGVAGATLLAGCSGLFETQSGVSLPSVLEDRPDAVYLPTHIEGMNVANVGNAGRYRVALTYSYPHRFWIVTGQDRERVEIQSDDSVHLMATIWDRETGLVVPNGDLRVTVTQDGESITSRSMWPMLSQNMGFHFGDNIALPGEGTYTVEITIGPMSVRRTGPFQEAFGESSTVELSFELDMKELRDVAFEQLDDAGQQDAVDPMVMDMVPTGQLPERDQLPGQILGEVTSGDGVFVATALAEPPAGVEGSGTYLALSARTPYNRYPLPFMSLSGTLERDGETLFEDRFTETIHPELDYHYGAVVDSVEPGDTLTISVGAPPQLARHEGYETAFFEMDDAELSV